MKSHKAIFETKVQPDDQFSQESPRWEMVCEEFGTLRPLTGRELIDAQQVQAQQTHDFRTTYSADTARVTTAHRLKLAKPVLVDEQNVNAEENFRIFQITSIINVREMNRELQILLIEKV